MNYMLLIYRDEAVWQSATPARTDEITAAYMAYAGAMQQAGILRGGERLRPVDAATTVRVTDGKTQVLNGPYAETKEQLGGFFIIDVPDLDAALTWAARCPDASQGTMEVRPAAAGGYFQLLR